MKNLNFETPLCKLAEKYGTDKNTVHKYTSLYHNWFCHLRDQEINLLEIGVLNGASIKMWLEYFPKANIFAVDFKSSRLDSVVNLERVACVKLHQGKGRDWNKFKRLNPELKLDIVIDDGSHQPRDQWVSFYHLYPVLNRGGFYVVEDLTHADAFVGDDHPFVNSVAKLVSEKLLDRSTVNDLNIHFVRELVCIRR